MIYIDIDNVMIAFTETLKKHFGIELALDNYDTFHWFNGHCEKCGWACKFPTPQEFYANADLMPRALEMLDALLECECKFATKDYAGEKAKCLRRTALICDAEIIEEPDKTKLCQRPNDILVSDYSVECEAWRAKGGIAFWWDLSKPDIWELFQKWWRL